MSEKEHYHMTERGHQRGRGHIEMVDERWMHDVPVHTKIDKGTPSRQLTFEAIKAHESKGTKWHSVDRRKVPGR